MKDCYQYVNIKLIFSVWTAGLSFCLNTSHKQLIDTQYFKIFFKKSILPQHIQVYSVTGLSIEIYSQ